MTVHGAKGREFDCVYLVGLAEDVHPSFQSKQTGDKSPEMEEERRNCFVAITRAKECLILCRAEHIVGSQRCPPVFSWKWVWCAPRRYDLMECGSARRFQPTASFPQRVTATCDHVWRETVTDQDRLEGELWQARLDQGPEDRTIAMKLRPLKERLICDWIEAPVPRKAEGTREAGLAPVFREQCVRHGMRCD
jgi:hypothetical protein